MTNITFLRCRDVGGAFSCRHFTVMATTARSLNLRMIHSANYGPVRHAMARLTFVGGRDMRRPFALR